jgi:hypothetical protein
MNRTWLAGLLIILQPLAKAQAANLNDTPSIPEPMVFDLVRPLGAKSGEWEVNSLFSMPLTGDARRFSWAPETEYAFARGYAVEPQILFENGRFQGFQLTGQKTFGTLWHNKAIHGTLLRGEYIRADNRLLSDAVYLFGVRFNKRWSAFTISGLRRIGYWNDGRFVGLLNPTIFYHINENLQIGVENNFQLGASSANKNLLAPQVQWTLARDMQLQCGLGIEYSKGNSPRLLAICRIVKRLN